MIVISEERTRFYLFMFKFLFVSEYWTVYTYNSRVVVLVSSNAIQLSLSLLEGKISEEFSYNKRSFKEKIVSFN